MRTDSWRPTASMRALKERARVLRRVREFFHVRGVLEVETPICSACATTDPALAAMNTRYSGAGAPHAKTLYLHTSPEFAMKRLLASGSGPVFQICKVFRNREFGSRHNPEFTLLEWYRPGFDHFDLMDEVTALVNALNPVQQTLHKYTYRQLFETFLGLDPHAATIAELSACATSNGIIGASDLELDAEGYRDLLLTHHIEPELKDSGMIFVYDYPAAQASLARIRPGNPPLAERFELYLNGIEIANGFHELTDAAEQRQRFDRELQQRRENDEPEVPMDVRLLAALEAGMPECAGVALGVDRLLMQLLGVASIDQVLTFPLDRA